MAISMVLISYEISTNFITLFPFEGIHPGNYWRRAPGIKQFESGQFQAKILSK